MWKEKWNTMTSSVSPCGSRRALSGFEPTKGTRWRRQAGWGTHEISSACHHVSEVVDWNNLSGSMATKLILPDDHHEIWWIWDDLGRPAAKVFMAHTWSAGITRRRATWTFGQPSSVKGWNPWGGTTFTSCPMRPNRVKEWPISGWFTPYKLWFAKKTMLN